MSIKEQIEADVKQAMLAGNKTLVTTLRGLKSAILNVEVAEGIRETGLPDERVIDLFAKEAKKRQESADLYLQGGDETRAQAELGEKAVIEKYLPKQLSDEELAIIIDTVIQASGASGPQAMGQVIGQVKAKTAGAADGARIATLVKERLNR
jgi:uncharacterized protein YqeY